MAPVIPPPPGMQPAGNMELEALPPPKTKPIVQLILRGLTAVLTFISLIILTTNTFKLTVIYDDDYNQYTTTYHLKFNDFISYRYMLFTILLGLLYSILQVALTLFHLTSGKPLSNVLVFVDFFGDLVLLYALASGASAGFAVSVDYGRDSKDFHVFFAKANATASMLFLGSVCSAVSLVFAAFGLEKRHLNQTQNSY